MSVNGQTCLAADDGGVYCTGPNRRPPGRRDHDRQAHPRPDLVTRHGQDGLYQLHICVVVWFAILARCHRFPPEGMGQRHLVRSPGQLHGVRRPRPRLRVFEPFPRQLLADGASDAYRQLRVVRFRRSSRPTLRPLLDAATGVISGTPTEASAQTTYTIHANASNGTDSTSLDIEVLDPTSVSGPTSVQLLLRRTPPSRTRTRPGTP